MAKSKKGGAKRAASGGAAEPAAAPSGVARSLDTALEVEGVSEEWDFLQANPCACGGAWELEEQKLLQSERTPKGSRMTDEMNVCCGDCGRKETYYFVVQYDGEL